MAYDFVTMQNEVLARGFNFLDTTRLKRFLNEAMHEVDDAEPWEYLYTSTTGTGTVTISDLGFVESVVDTSYPRPLALLPRDEITNLYGDITLTGVPVYYWVQDTAPQVQVFPVSASTPLSVRYRKVATDLSGNTDVPLMPDRFRGAIVEYAVARALRDRSNWQEAQAAQLAGDAIVERMREFYAQRGGDVMRQEITFASEDW